MFHNVLCKDILAMEALQFFNFGCTSLKKSRVTSPVLCFGDTVTRSNQLVLIPAEKETAFFLYDIV